MVNLLGNTGGGGKLLQLGNYGTFSQVLSCIVSEN